MQKVPHQSTFILKPVNPDSYNETLTIISDDPDTPSFVVNLTGTAIDPPVITIDPSSI